MFFTEVDEFSYCFSYNGERLSWLLFVFQSRVEVGRWRMILFCFLRKGKVYRVLMNPKANNILILPPKLESRYHKDPACYITTLTVG